jgi:hypothetical protein
MNYLSQLEGFFEFSIKRRYSEEECLLFFPQLQDGCYEVDASIWLIRIQDSGAYFVEDEVTHRELVQNHPEFFQNTPEMPSDVAVLFKDLKDDFEVHLTPQVNAILEILESSKSDLSRPESN